MLLSEDAKRKLREVRVEEGPSEFADTTLEELIEDCYIIFGEDCDLELAFAILEGVGVPVSKIKSKDE